MLEDLRQQEGEDDEAFLLRAERVAVSESDKIQSFASELVSEALRHCDKPEVISNEDALRQLTDSSSSESSYIKLRAVLRARSECRRLQDLASGEDVAAHEAYALLSRMALAALRP